MQQIQQYLAVELALKRGLVGRLEAGSGGQAAKDLIQELKLEVAEIEAFLGQGRSVISARRNLFGRA